MVSVKLLVLDALINHLANLLCREEVPVFSDAYFDLFDRLVHARCALRTR